VSDSPRDLILYEPTTVLGEFFFFLNSLHETINFIKCIRWVFIYITSLLKYKM